MFTYHGVMSLFHVENEATIRGQYKYTVGLVMKSHNLRTGKILGL